MHGFGSHTYSMYNDKGERVWVKYHFRTQQGIENYTDEEAAKIVGMDRDSSQRIYIMLSKMEIIQNGKCTFKL